MTSRSWTVYPWQPKDDSRTIANGLRRERTKHKLEVIDRAAEEEEQGRGPTDAQVMTVLGAVLDLHPAAKRDLIKAMEALESGKLD